MELRKLLIICFLAVSFSAYSQRFNGGLLIGLDASQVDGDSYSGFHRFGGIYGAFVNLMLSENSGVQMEIRYIGKGSADTATYGNRYRLNLHYLEVPLMYNYYWKKMIFDGGLTPGYLMSSVEEDINGIFPSSTTIPFKKFELEGSLGISYMFFDRFRLRLSYNYSILSIRSLPKGYTNPIIGQSLNEEYNNLFSFTLYYRINKKEASAER